MQKLTRYRQIINHVMCDRRSAISAVILATMLFTLPFIEVIPYCQSIFLNWLERNLCSVGFFVLLAFDIMRRNFGRSIAYGITFVFLSVAVALSICFGPMMADLVTRRQFDSTLWKSASWDTATGQHTHIRLRMVDDLLEHHELVGMSRAQIIDLLGKPSTCESNQTESEYIYYLGPERGFISIDDEWLDITFRKDVVTSAIDRTD